MSLKTGNWKMNDNGVEIMLTIDAVNTENGEVSGKIGGVGPFVGLWDETSRTITLVSPVTPVGATTASIVQPVPRLYKGFLMSTPRNPVPGQDVVWTLAGFIQIPDFPTAASMGGNARRSTFGWFAQITEVA